MVYLLSCYQIIKNAFFILGTYHENLVTPIAALSGFYLWIPITIFTLILCSKTKKLFFAYIVISSTIMVAVTIYLRGFSALPTFSSIKSANNLSNLSILSNAFELLKPIDILFFLDIPVLFFMKTYKKPVTPRWLTITSAFITIFAFYCGQTVTNLNNQRAIYMGGLNGYITALFFLDSGPIKLSEKQNNDIKDYFSNKKQHQLKSIFKNKNIVIILTESLENFIVKDKVITPNINNLMKHAYYFEVKEQVEQGMSSDAEFMLTTGILPVRSGNAFENYPTNIYPQSLPKLFEQQGYITQVFHSDSAEIWNWKQAMSSIGFQRCYDKSFFKGHVTGIGIDDKPFLEQVGEQISKNRSPFMAFVMTSTSHMPFRTPDKPLMANKYDDYKQVIKYTDNAIGEMLKKLPPDTVVIISGDHESIHKFYPQEKNAPTNNKMLPFIIYHESISGKKINIPAGQIDIMPTILSLFGLESNKTIGEDLFNNKGTFETNSSQIRTSDMIIRGNYFKHHLN